MKTGIQPDPKNLTHALCEGSHPDDAGALNHTLQRLLNHCGFDRSWVRGQGVWLWDRNDRRFLDFYSQYGAVALGHGAKRVIDAVRDAFESGLPAMVQPYRACAAEALAKELSRLSGLCNCIFASSGSEVVEAAIKVSRARSGRALILSAEGSYHGKTMGALAATGQPQYSIGFGPSPAGFGRFAFGEAASLERCLQEHKGEVAAVLLEPIQGERGVIVPPPGYLRTVRELCWKHQVALILDEVQTGLGRTGHLFAFQREEAQPDVLLLAKALGGGLFPLAACLVSEQWWDEGFALRHSSTFANNNVACQVGLAVVDELTTGGLVERAAKTGERLQTRLRRLSARFPKSVSATRGVGLLGAVELTPRDQEDGFLLGYFTHQGLLSYMVAAALAERSGVLVLPTLGSSNTLRLAPPLIVTEEQIDTAMDALESVLVLLENADSAAVVRSIGATSSRHEPSSVSLRRPRLYMPMPAASPRQRHRYAFVVHYTRPEDVVATDPMLARLKSSEFGRYCEFAAMMPAGMVMRAPVVRSPSGETADGIIIAVPMLPEQMLRVGRKRVVSEIQRAVDLAAQLGASVVGLGGFTTPYSHRGLDAIGRGPAITTGNTLTALMAVDALLAVATAQGLDISAQRVAVVGAGGSVGRLCARLLAELHPARLVLVGNPESPAQHLHALAAELTFALGSVKVATSWSELSNCRLVISATGAVRPVLEQAELAARTIVCDVARPFDTTRQMRARTDITVIDGGLVALPDPTLRFGVGNLQGLPNGVQLACLSETILLALSGETKDVGVGDQIDLATARRIQALAQHHRFTLAAPMRDGQLLLSPLARLEGTPRPPMQEEDVA